MCKLSTFGRECEELGYSVEKMTELAELVNRRVSLEKRISAQKKRLRALTQAVKDAEKRLTALTTRSRGLSAVDEILRTGETWVACSHCDRTLIVPVPGRRELKRALREGLGYRVRCGYCGHRNRIGVRYVLVSIGWETLARHYG